VDVRWTGNTGEGTRSHKSYEREHEISAAGCPSIPASSDPNFHGDPARWSPELLLVAAPSACHKLWYLHLCAANGIVLLAELVTSVSRVQPQIAEAPTMPSGSGAFGGPC
jgi:organic hydroperoxide reductase OsmC/OhrA